MLRHPISHLPCFFSHLSKRNAFKHLKMPRYGVSESGIGCKDSENNDKLYVFQGFFSCRSPKKRLFGYTYGQNKNCHKM